MKLDAVGNIQWQKNIIFTGRICNGVAVRETSDHGFVVLAEAIIPAFSNFDQIYDFLFVKIDSDGKIQWQKLFDNRKKDFPKDICVLSDGGYVLVGNSWNYGVSTDVWIIRLDSLGEVKWQRLYGGSFDDSPSAILETLDGGLVLTGTSRQYGDVPWALKLSVDGELLWQRKYASLNEYGDNLEIARSDNGSFMLSGGSVFLLKVDPAGIPMWWARPGRSEGMNYWKGFQGTKDNGYILSRRLINGDILISKADSDGNTCFGLLKRNQISYLENDFKPLPSQGQISSPQVTFSESDLSVRNTNVVPSTDCISSVPELFINYDFNFGKVEVGSYALRYAIIANNGGVDLNISSIDLRGSGVDEFKLNSNCGNLYPSGTCTVNVTFAPRSTGDKSAIMTVKSNDPSRPSVEIPLLGTGVDTRPPVITLNGDSLITVEAGAPPYVDAGATAFDLADDDLTAAVTTINPVNTAAVGTYTVTYNVADRAGNTAQMTRTVQVVDTIPPSVSISTDRNILWPPNRKMVEVSVGGAAEDDGSGIAAVEIRVADEYGILNGAVAGFGNRVPLEAWREGSDRDGRVYTLTVIATDKAGNAATASTTVTVPHDQRK